MAHPAMAAVAGLGVHAIELAHAFGQIAIRRLHQKMVVVVHQTPGIAEPVELVDDLTQCLEKSLPIQVVVKNVFAPIASGGDVIERIGKFNTEGARHGGRIASGMLFS